MRNIGGSMNFITVHGLELTVKLGCTAEERAFPQKVVFDLDLYLDFSPVIKSDDMGDTVDYMPIVNSLRGLLAKGEWRMIEKLAWDVAQHVLAAAPRLSKVGVRAEKNILAGCKGFSATVSCSRG